jgi:hypothetical protein
MRKFFQMFVKHLTVIFVVFKGNLGAVVKAVAL